MEKLRLFLKFLDPPLTTIVSYTQHTFNDKHVVVDTDAAIGTKSSQ